MTNFVADNSFDEILDRSLSRVVEPQAPKPIRAELKQLENALGSSGLARFAAGVRLPGETTPASSKSLSAETARFAAELKAKQAELSRNDAEIKSLEAKRARHGLPSPAKLAAARNVMGAEPMARALASGAFDPPGN